MQVHRIPKTLWIGSPRAVLRHLLVQLVRKEVGLWLELELPAKEPEYPFVQLIVLRVVVAAQPVCPFVLDTWHELRMHEDVLGMQTLHGFVDVLVDASYFASFSPCHSVLELSVLIVRELPLGIAVLSVITPCPLARASLCVMCMCVSNSFHLNAQACTSFLRSCKVAPQPLSLASENRTNSLLFCGLNCTATGSFNALIVLCKRSCRH